MPTSIRLNPLIVSTVTGAYEQSRMDNKNSVLFGVLIFLKPLFGMGFLIFHFYFGRAGVLLSTATTVAVTCLVCYFMLIALRIADDMEEKDIRDRKIETMDQAAKRVLGGFLGLFTKLLIISFNLFTIIANCMNFSRFLVERIAVWSDIAFLHNIIVYKAIFVLVVIVITVVLVEPEKIKITCLISVVTVIAVMVITTGLALDKIGKDGVQSVKLFEPENASTMTSSLFFAMEGIATLFSTRATLKRPSKMKQVVKVCGLCVILLYVGYSFILVFVS